MWLNMSMMGCVFDLIPNDFFLGGSWRLLKPWQLSSFDMNSLAHDQFNSAQYQLTVPPTCTSSNRCSLMNVPNCPTSAAASLA